MQDELIMSVPENATPEQQKELERLGILALRELRTTPAKNISRIQFQNYLNSIKEQRILSAVTTLRHGGSLNEADYTQEELIEINRLYKGYLRLNEMSKQAVPWLRDQ